MNKTHEVQRRSNAVTEPFIVKGKSDGPRDLELSSGTDCCAEDMWELKPLLREKCYKSANCM